MHPCVVKQPSKRTLVLLSKPNAPFGAIAKTKRIVGAKLWCGGNSDCDDDNGGDDGAGVVEVVWCGMAAAVTRGCDDAADKEKADEEIKKGKAALIVELKAIEKRAENKLNEDNDVNVNENANETDNEDDADQNDDVDEVLTNIETLPFLNTPKISKKKDDGKGTFLISQKQSMKQKTTGRESLREVDLKNLKRKKQTDKRAPTKGQ
ncbi:hypothetical protein Tco_1412669 [Tanacetum coccineum]